MTAILLQRTNPTDATGLRHGVYYIIIIKRGLGGSTALRVEFGSIFLRNLNFQKSWSPTIYCVQADT